MEAKKTTIQFIKEAANKLKDCKMKRLTAPHTQSVIEGVMKGVGLKNIRQAMLFVPMFDNSCGNSGLLQSIRLSSYTSLTFFSKRIE